MEVLSAAAAPSFSIYRVICSGESRHGHRIRFFPNSPIIPHHRKTDSNCRQTASSSLNNTEDLTKADRSTAKRSTVNTYSTILSAIFAPALARALTYEEALQQAGGSSPNEAAVGFDLNGITDAVVNFSSENPVAIIAGIVLVAVPLVLGRILQKPQTWGTVSAENAYSKLEAEADSQLIDIRTAQDAREVGSPDLRSLKKRAVQVTYAGDDESFLKKLSAKFKDPANTTLYVLDKFDGNSATVARLLAENGFKSAFAIKDGAEGRRGWQNSRLPWLAPKKAFTVDFGILTEAIAGTVEENPGLVPVTVGVAAATGISLSAFSEIEAALQLLGSAALIQLFLKKFLFAKDRKRTLQQLQDFLDNKIAPKEFVGELVDIGKALLPKTVDVTTNNGSATTQSRKVDDSVIVAVNAEDAEKQTSESASVAIASGTEITGNSAPQSAPVESVAAVPNVAAESSLLSRPLSPYPHYPDFKPPTSPTPSRP